MKKILTILITLMILTGCSSTSSSIKIPTYEEILAILNIRPLEDNDQTKHIEELDEKYVYEITKARRNYLEAFYDTKNRSDLIKVVKEDDRYYYFDDNNLMLAVDKRYVRDVSKPIYESFDGYTRAGANLYPDLNFKLSESKHTFSKNEIVTVIDEIEDTYYVEYDGVYGFMFKTQVSKTFIPNYVAPKVQIPEYSYDSGGGNDSGGGSGGGGNDNPPPATSSGDGEDITLYFKNGNVKTVFLSDVLNMDMMVLIYDCPTYIRLYDRLEEIKYTDQDDENLYVLVNGYPAIVKKVFTQAQEGAEEYEAWDGYAYAGADIYYDYNLENLITSAKKNDVIHVIDKINDIYVVELKDGTIGYMLTSELSVKKLSTYVAPKVVETPAYDSGSDDGGGGGGGGGSSEPSAPAEPEWTPPIL